MMPISSATKVRDVALELPQSTRGFEELRIDYCCGGDMPLNTACATAGLEVENVMRRLEQLRATEAPGNGSLDLQNATLSALIGHILDKHHVFTRNELQRISLLFPKVCSAHAAKHPELLQIQFEFQKLCGELGPHMMKEENILFPYIARLEEAAAANLPSPFAPFGTVQNPISMMMQEHDAAADILRTIRKLSRDFEVPASACFSYQTLYEALRELEQDLHQHIHLENNMLFPKAIELELTR